MGVINQLDRTVYNRISAGEVVENPASVVKELVENAIDAGSTEIAVSIESGGIKSIIVSDNGCGMEREDIQNCILPHATSKINTVEDLGTISTLGFRGEALASICAVSKMTIRSFFVKDEKANYIKTEGGEIVETGECTLGSGTTMEVESLFYNTPARYKFLKQPKGEENAVTRLMNEIILSNPYIEFLYTVDGETVYSSDGNGLESAICTVFGAKTFEEMIPFKIEDNGYVVSGFTARPASCAIKGNKNNEIFIVNGRLFTDETMQIVVANAYGNHLMHRSFPSVIVDIVMPFDEVDVNVHPGKREVRFSDSRRICGFVYNAIKDALQKDEENKTKNLIESLTVTDSEENREGKQPFVPEGGDGLTAVLSDPVKVDDVFYDDDEKMDLVKVYGADIFEKGEKEKAANRFGFGLSDKKKKKNIDIEYDEEEDATWTEKIYIPDGWAEQIRSRRVLGQLFKTYIVIEMGDNVYLIDQHAAHERMLFNQFTRELKHALRVQDLLLPRVVEVDKEHAAFFAEHIGDFAALGFAIEADEEVVSVYSIPTSLTGLDIDRFIENVNIEANEIKDLSDLSTFRDKLAQMACKAAIKAGDIMADKQAEYFLDEYLTENAPQQCPHGRPIVVTVSKREIEKMFGRVL